MRDETTIEVFRLLLMYRAVDPAEVMGWAENRVLSEAAPPDWALNIVSVDPDTTALYDALLAGPRDERDDAVLIGVLTGMGRAVERGLLTPRSAAAALESLAIDEYLPHDKQGCFYYFADGYRAADEGYGSAEKLDDEVLTFLRTGGGGNAV